MTRPTATGAFMRTASIARRSVLLALPGALVAGALVGTSAAVGDRSGGVVRISTVSDRADLISGGDALVRRDVRAGHLGAGHIRLNGRDVTAAFRRSSDGHGLGLLTGLRLGRNMVSVELPNGSGANLVVTNHPLGGPVFNGPQIKPWTCSNGSKNPKCYQKRPYSHSYVYQPGGTQSSAPSRPPPDGCIK